MSVPTAVTDMCTLVAFGVSSAAVVVREALFTETLGVGQVEPGFVVVLIVSGAVVPVMDARIPAQGNRRNT